MYKHTDDGVFDDFPKISDHLGRFRRFFKLSRRLDEHSWTFSENFRKFPKMSEDFRRLPSTFEEDRKMFRWYTNEFKYNLRDKPDVSEIIDIFTCKISYFYVCSDTTFLGGRNPCKTLQFVQVITWFRVQFGINKHE